MKLVSRAGWIRLLLVALALLALEAACRAGWIDPVVLEELRRTTGPSPGGSR